MSSSPSVLLRKLLKVVEEEVVPLTAEGVAKGSKLFGAAILTKEGLESVQVATNDESWSPLLHGEINCLMKYWGNKDPSRPTTKECVFLATHEPCSLCLSGITWSGFDNFYYLFTYEDSRDLFSIPYDIDILEQVFRTPAPTDTPATLAERPLYNKTNNFFKASSFADLALLCPEEEQAELVAEIKRVKELYNGLSATYQTGKAAGKETSSVFK